MAIYGKFEERFLDNIRGVSYIGNPKNYTMMYLTKKIESKIVLLTNIQGSLVFLEDSIGIPEVVANNNTLITCKDPASSYTEVALLLAKQIEMSFREKNYNLAQGFVIGQDVVVEDDTYIEPGVFIDHEVKIGKKCLIKTGSRIRRGTVIGDNCIIGENTVIGDPAFNTATISDERFVVIPSFGGVRIGNNVFLGANNAISKGSADDTIIEDNVKMDASVRIGHDVHLHRNVEIMGCAGIGGYCEIGEYTIIASGASLKNRITIGKHCFIGMGSVVHHDIRDNLTVTGNPGITLEQAAKKKIIDVKLRELLKKLNGRG